VYSLAVVAMADVLRHRFAGQLHLDDTAITGNTGDRHVVALAAVTGAIFAGALFFGEFTAVDTSYASITLAE
jgi:hypothetical protein